MKHKLLFLLPLLAAASVFPQPDPAFCPCFADSVRSRTLRVCFYNMENFFDYADDSLTNDGDFTPSGAYHWNASRYYHKADQIGKVLVAAGGWEPPDIIGLAELENESVIRTLLYHTALKKWKYRYVHFDSPDPRGVDVALLYRPDRFECICSEAVPVSFSKSPESRTRDILYVCGKAAGSDDTVHFFVCHFTSRYSGYKATVSKRCTTASILRERAEAIRTGDPEACVLMMGDFNDTPSDSSMRHYLGARLDTLHPDDGFVNLMYPFVRKNSVGTHKFHRDWSVLDQFVVTPCMLRTDAPYRVASPACIFAAAFMLADDEKYLGQKPFRTFVGRRYKGGFSDHLPIVLDLAY